MAQASRRISVEIDAGEGPVRGRVIEDDGLTHEFEGWLSLLTVLGHLLDAPPSPGDRPAPPAG